RDSALVFHVAPASARSRWTSDAGEKALCRADPELGLVRTEARDGDSCARARVARAASRRSSLWHPYRTRRRRTAEDAARRSPSRRDAPVEECPGRLEVGLSRAPP